MCRPRAHRIVYSIRRIAVWGSGGKRFIGVGRDFGSKSVPRHQQYELTRAYGHVSCLWVTVLDVSALGASHRLLHKTNCGLGKWWKTVYRCWEAFYGQNIGTAVPTIRVNQSLWTCILLMGDPPGCVGTWRIASSTP